MKVGIKVVALLLYLILATKAAPKGNGKAGGAENEGAEAREAGGEGEAGEAGEQGEVGEAGEQGEMDEAAEQGEVGEAGEMGEVGEEEGLAEGGEVGEEGGNAVTGKLPNTIVKSQPPTAVTPLNEKPAATSYVTEAATTKKQRAGVSGSVVPEVASEMNTMPLVTPDDFNYLDKNGDGFLDYRELFLGQNNFNPIYLNAAFQISDKNFDGVVDQQEFFRHPLSWGRVVAEKQFFTKDISTIGAGTTEYVTSQPDVTPTAEQTYTASPDGTSPQLPEDNVTTTVASAEQNTTDLTVPDQQTSVPTDTSTTAHVSVVDNANGGQSVAPAKGTTVQTRTVPKVTQGQKEGANGKAGGQVGSKAGASNGSKIGHPTRGKEVDRPVGAGVVPNGGQSTARKGAAVAGSTEGQAGKAIGQKDQKKTGAWSSGGQPSAVPGSVGGHGQRGRDGQKHGQAGSHAVTVAGKTRGHAMSHGVQHRTTAAIHTPGVHSGVSVHPGGTIRGRTVAYGHSQTAPVSWHWKAQGHAKPQYHPWGGQKWVKADVEQGVSREMGGSFYGKSKEKGIAKSAGMEKKYSPDQKKEGTKEDAQSEEEEEEESSNEAEDKKYKNKNGKENGDNESEDTDDKDKNDKE